MYCVCCYFEEALQPRIPTAILKSHATVAKQGRGVAGLSALFADGTVTIPSVGVLSNLLEKPILLFIPCALPSARGQSSEMSTHQACALEVPHSYDHRHWEMYME